MTAYREVAQVLGSVSGYWADITNVAYAGGATLNDSKDDYAAYQSAINAVSAAGGGLVLHPQNGTKSARISQPLIVLEGVGVFGLGSHGAVSGAAAPSRIAAHSTFPTCLVNGAQTLPASPRTPFTLAVKGGAIITGTDGHVNAGSANFVSASASFPNAAAGKRIVIAGAGIAGADLTTTVSTRNSPTNLTLATTASTSVTAAAYTVGTSGDHFPLGPGGLALAGGVGVLCVQGVTIHYTGVAGDGQSFTGCTTNDIGVTLGDGRAVSTFVVWMGEPGLIDTATSCYLKRMRVNGANIAGVSCIHSSRIAESSGLFDVQVDGFKNFGVRIEMAPRVDGDSTNAPANFELRKLDLALTADTVPGDGKGTEPEAIALDMFGSGLRSDGTTQHMAFSMLKYRGVSDVSVSGVTTTSKGRAAVRVNGYGGGTLQNINMEGPTVAHGAQAGIILGDQVRTRLVVIGASSSNAMDAPIIQIGACAVPTPVFGVMRNYHSPSPTSKLIDDQFNGYSNIEGSIGWYMAGTNGAVFTDSGLIGSTAPIATKAGVPSDADYTVPPPIGTLALDTTGPTLYCRVAVASWKKVALT